MGNVQFFIRHVRAHPEVYGRFKGARLKSFGRMRSASARWQVTELCSNLLHELLNHNQMIPYIAAQTQPLPPPAAWPAAAPRRIPP
jgi:hypothetical protein